MRFSLKLRWTYVYVDIYENNIEQRERETIKQTGGRPKLIISYWGYICSFSSTRVWNFMFKKVEKEEEIDQHSICQGWCCQLEPMTALKFECHTFRHIYSEYTVIFDAMKSNKKSFLRSWMATTVF